MSNINEGLQQHFEHEERTLPPLIGVLLTKALGQEHSELPDKFAKARILVNESNLERAKQRGTVSQKLRYKECGYKHIRPD